MKLKISVVKGSKEGTFIANFATSICYGKDATLKEVSDYAAKLIKAAEKQAS